MIGYSDECGDIGVDWTGFSWECRVQGGWGEMKGRKMEGTE